MKFGNMTVKELIEQLQQYPDDMRVTYGHPEAHMNINYLVVEKDNNRDQQTGWVETSSEDVLRLSSI